MLTLGCGCWGIEWAQSWEVSPRHGLNRYQELQGDGQLRDPITVPEVERATQSCPVQPT